MILYLYEKIDGSYGVLPEASEQSTYCNALAETTTFLFFFRLFFGCLLQLFHYLISPSTTLTTSPLFSGCLLQLFHCLHQHHRHQHAQFADLQEPARQIAGDAAELFF